MIEFIRRSLIQKAIEGDMKVLAAGSLKSGETANFTLAEGKTTLTICYCNQVSYTSENRYSSGNPLEGILKGQGTLCYNYLYSESDNILLQRSVVTITSNTIKSTSDFYSGAINYIIFEIDE